MRACGACDQKVYNVAGMTRAEAEALIQNAEGRLCLRLLRRHDGTVLTRDCPAPLRRQRQRTRWQRAALALGLGS